MDTLLQVLKVPSIPRVIHLDKTRAVILAGANLYRTGIEQDSITYKQQFFSSWQVAAAYAQEHRYLKTFTVNRDLNLLHITPDTLTFFIKKCMNRSTLSPSDYKKLFDFAVVFGYRLDDLFSTMGESETTAYEYFQTWAKTLLQYDEYIQISESFGVSQKKSQTLFNRISLSQNDHKVFEDLFKVEDPEVRAFLSDKSDGIYAPNLSSGMFNNEMLITAIGEFPEEVFIREIHAPPPSQKKKRRTVVAVAAVAAVAAAAVAAAAAADEKDKEAKEAAAAAVKWEEDFEYTSNKTNEHVIESFCTTKTDNELFTTFSYESITRIYLYTIIYQKLAASITDSINQMFSNVEESTLYYAQLKTFNHRFKVAMQEILVRMGRVVDVALMMDKELLDERRIPSQAENPFYVTTSTKPIFNGNLYIYTVMSNVIKAAIVELKNLHLTYYTEFVNATTSDGMYMIPVASGGVLFGIYTIGDEFRRLTKDVDVKFILNKDDPFYGSETALFAPSGNDFLWKQEIIHWNATMINFVWLNMIDHIFKETINHRSYIYAEKVKRHLIIHPKDSNSAWGVYAAGNPSTRILSNILAEGDAYIKRNKGTLDVPLLSTVFDHWLQARSPSISGISLNSLATYNEVLKRLLAKKKEMKTKWKDSGTRKSKGKGKRNGTMKAAAAGKASTDRDRERESADIQTVLKQMTNLIQNNDDFTIWCREKIRPDFFDLQRFIRLNKRMVEFVANRPKLLFHGNPSHAYSVGWFSSIYVYKRASPLDTLGLIDLTYDTHFSTICSFTKYAGVSEFGYVTVNGLNYGSSLWFIHESDKLNTICNVSTYPGDNTADYNPENECAPNKEKREEKKRKYAERYNKVRGFFIYYLSHCLNNPASIVYRMVHEKRIPIPTGDPSLAEIEHFLKEIYRSTEMTSGMTARRLDTTLQKKFDDELYTAIQGVYNKYMYYAAGF